MLPGVTTGVAADVGNVLRGGCSVDSICPSSLTVVTPGTGTYPGTQLNVNSPGPHIPVIISRSPRPGFQVQHIPPAPTSAAPRIPLSAKSALA